MEATERDQDPRERQDNVVDVHGKRNLYYPATVTPAER